MRTVVNFAVPTGCDLALNKVLAIILWCAEKDAS